MTHLKVGLNESGHIELEESIGETLSEKLEDFDEVVPDISASVQDIDHKGTNGDVCRDDNDNDDNEENRIIEKVVKIVEDQLENGVDHSPISNGHSIVTEVTIEAHDMTDLDQSVIVSKVCCAVVLIGVSLR